MTVIIVEGPSPLHMIPPYSQDTLQKEWGALKVYCVWPVFSTDLMVGLWQTCFHWSLWCNRCEWPQLGLGALSDTFTFLPVSIYSPYAYRALHCVPISSWQEHLEVWDTQWHLKPREAPAGMWAALLSQGSPLNKSDTGVMVWMTFSLGMCMAKGR